jgi:hypothetical protein
MNLPSVAGDEEAPMVVDSIHDLHADHHDPQHQELRQNIMVALLPLALIAFMVLTFIAATWTVLAAK